MKLRTVPTLCLLACCAAVLTSPPVFAAPKTTLRFSMETEIPALDPQKSNAIPAFNVGNAVFEGLIRTVDGKVTPGISDKWTISPDGKTLSFHLRDAKWSDGKPVTAHDFEYAFKRLLNPKTAAEYAFAAYYIKGAKDYNLGKVPNADGLGVKATDAKNLVITLDNPTPYFLGYLGANCFFPARQDVVEKLGDSYATAADKAIYNGPFTLKEWKNEQRKLLAKNPTYWNAKAIKLEAVEILQIADPTTALSMYESGELDLVNVPPNLFKQYADKGLAKVFFTGADDWMKVNIRPNPQKPWLANADFRRAIAWAIDREGYTNIATKGLYAPNLRYVLPLIMGVNKKYGDEYPLSFYTLKGDPAKAQEYLKKAMAALKIDSPSKITIEYLIQDQEETRLMAETLQQQIEKTLGIKMSIKLVTRKQRAQMEQQHEYELVYSGWGPDYDDPMTYMEIWLSDNSQNNAGYANPEYDKLVKGALMEKDAVKRMGMIAQAEKILLADASMIPLQLRRRVSLYNPKLQDMLRPIINVDYDFVYASFKP